MPHVVEERKRKLDGRTLSYPCEALEMTTDFALLLYRLPQAVDLAGVCLPAGARSFGLYWSERPYNVYHWVDAAGRWLGDYCNAATETRLGPRAVEWLDLEADVFITPDGRVAVLDLDEVPADLSAPHRRALEEALAALAAPAALVREVAARTAGW